jgi:predicted GNAT family acetyltransferase
MSKAARRLGPADAGTLAALLAEDEIQNVYLGSELRLHGLRSGNWWGAEERGRLRGAFLGGALVVPWLADLSSAGALADALDQQPPPRMLVGPRDHVLALQHARSASTPPREVRDPQPVMVLGRDTLRTQPSPYVRRGLPDDLERLTVAAAAMHHEEMGVDPLAVDPGGWKARMHQLVERGWSYVWLEGDEVVFKAELSAWTPQAAQLQGVYTAPPRRNRGFATAGLAAVCSLLFADVPYCCLYVNHFNAAARAVYEKLGFTTVAEYATLMF